MDPYPGFLNGVLSLLLNSQSPAFQYSQAEGTAVAYFHRARAAELVTLFDKRFPQSAEHSGLHASLLDAYAVYGIAPGTVIAASLRAPMPTEPVDCEISPGKD